MSDHPHAPRPGSAKEEAVDWFVRRDADPLSAAEQAAFEAWLAASPVHREAYAEVERVWSDLDSVPADQAPRLRPSGHRDYSEKTAIQRGRRAPNRRPWRWAATGAMAAGICLLLAIGMELPSRLQADVLSSVGETKTVALPDGSTAVLNTASAIAMDYSPDERRVRLLRGEAEFTVAKDAARPFRVETEGVLSKALGTVFLVRRHDDGTTVTVLESRVAVAYGGNSDSTREAILAANQQVTYTEGRGLGSLQTVDPRAATAWRRGKLIFVDQTLGDVIDELNRYHLGQILISDDALRNMKVNGVFETRDTVAVVDALETSLALSSTRLTDLLILLHR